VMVRKQLLGIRARVERSEPPATLAG
jgi:hypothetical protein